MPNDPATDRANLLELKRGDALALNRLIARWQRPLLGFAHRYLQNSADSEDVVSETFARLYRRRDELRTDTNVSAWLFTTLTNLCHNQHRWRRRHPTVSFSSATDEGGGDRPGAPDPIAVERSPDEAMEDDEAVQALKLAIDELPHELKTSVLLHHYEQLSYREIAAITRCSERGVETRLYRARLRLKASLTVYLSEASRS